MNIKINMWLFKQVIWPTYLTLMLFSVSTSVTLPGVSWWARATWRAWRQRKRRGPWAPRTTWWTRETGLSCMLLLFPRSLDITTLKDKKYSYLMKNTTINILSSEYKEKQQILMNIHQIFFLCCTVGSSTIFFFLNRDLWDVSLRQKYTSPFFIIEIKHTHK